jgi:hypothetical protein
MLVVFPSDSPDRHGAGPHHRVFGFVVRPVSIGSSHAGRGSLTFNMQEHDMETQKSLWLALLAVAALGGGGEPARSAGNTRGAANAVVLEWDEMLTAHLPATAGLFSFRYYAMMHVAIFDAVSSIERKYEPHHVMVPASPAASAEAAAAQAARDVLAALVPSAVSAFDAALAARLATIQKQRAAQGVAVGKKVAQAVLDWRMADGSAPPDPPYTPAALPGLWQPTPPTQVAAGTRYANVEPFGLLTATQYLPDPPPLLNSEEYAADLNQVKELGETGSGVRTAEQTLLAKLFAGPPNYVPGPFALWSKVARDVVGSRQMSLSATARLFAMMNVAMHDGLQTSHTSKFVYGLWRPITAIRRADEDANDATSAVADWTPLLGTPPYPSHSSNLTCIGVSAARTLARVLRSDDVPFEVTWTGLAGNADVTRTYGAFSQLAEEGGLSRVYGGIHFMFEIEDSVEACRNVADYVVDSHMRRRR